MRRSVFLCALGGFAILLFGAFPGCRKAEDAWPSNGKKRVLCSFAPLYCFAQSVAGADADVRCLLTAQGPHDFQATSNEVLMTQKADLILINGLGLDEWVKTKLLKGKNIEVVEVGEELPATLLIHPAEEAKDDGHGHKHGEHDPHVWLGPLQAKAMVATIGIKLGELDPKNKKNYADRAEAYEKELDKLHEYGKAQFANKKSRNIVATHDSLQYFSLAFDLKVVGTMQPRAGIEADAKALTGLVEICKKEGVTVIAVEPQYSKGPALALQAQLGKRGVEVQVVEVDPLETAPAAADSANPKADFYMEQMYRNIDNLAKALP